MTQEITVNNFTPEQLKLITNTIAKKATPDELQLFLYRAKNMGLDPLKPGQIHFVKYKDSSPGSIVVGIEGFRSIAHRTGLLTGIKRGALKDAKGQLIGGWAEVYRKDWKEPAREEAPLSEYNAGTPTWLKMPETMIKKVAECAALRMAFPNDLGGVYAPEEMDQAEHQTQNTIIKPQQPTIGDGNINPSQWTFGFGKWKQRSVEELYNDPSVGADGLKSYVNFLEDSAYKSGKELSPGAKEAIEHIDKFLGVAENNIHNALGIDSSGAPDMGDIPF